MNEVLFARHPDPMWIFDPETLAFVEVNEAAIAQYGYSREAFLAMTIADIRPPEDVPSLMAYLASDRKNGARYGRHRRSDGSLVGVEVRAYDVPHEGRLCRMVMARDVTALLEVEQEWRRVAMVRRMAGRVARLGGWQVIKATGEVVWTDQTAEIFGYPEGEVPTVPEAMLYYSAEDRQRISDAFYACLDSGEAFDEVVRVENRIGQRLRVHVMGEAERDENGAIVSVVGAIQDVSELFAARAQSDRASRQLGSILQGIRDPICVLDDEWNLLFCNDNALHLLGCTRDQGIGQHFWSIPTGLTGSVFETELRRVRSEGASATLTAHHDQSGEWLEMRAYPTPGGVAVQFTVVTQQREQQEQMRLLQAAFARANDVVLITDADSIEPPGGPRIVYVNDAFVEQTGFSREEAIGATPRILQGPGTQRDTLDRIRRALAHWRPVREEVLNFTKDGQEFWAELDITPVRDDHGWVTHWLSIQRDITDRKRADAEISLSHERMRMIGKATHDVIWDWDLLTDQIWWNENICTLFGYTPGDVCPKATWWTDRIDPDDRDRVLSSIEDLIASGGGSLWRQEYGFRRGDGSFAAILDRGFILRDDAGRAVRMVGSMLDLTARHALDEQLRQSQKLEAVGQLTGGIAHDFNNLLTVILGNAEMLADSLAGNDELLMLAEMTASAAERGADLTGRLLAFARRQPLMPQAVDVGRLVAGMDVLARRTLSGNVEIEFVRSADLWWALVDPGQLEAALLNLAINARDAMPGGGTMTIRTANLVIHERHADAEEEIAPGEYVLISVTDTGTGMTPEVAARAFDPFFTTKEVGKGSGLGLSMVYGFAKQSGGDARIDSRSGRGTTVSLYVPRALTEETAIAAAPARPALPRGTEHILVVEDDELVREYVSAQLRGLGYRVSSAANGPAAIALLRQATDIDLLFTDIVMPGGMNGSQVAAAARAILPDLKILFTSGYTENTIFHPDRLDAAVALVGKPYRRAELATKVRWAIDGWPAAQVSR